MISISESKYSKENPRPRSLAPPPWAIIPGAAATAGIGAAALAGKGAKKSKEVVSKAAENLPKDSESAGEVVGSGIAKGAIEGGKLYVKGLKKTGEVIDKAQDISVKTIKGTVKGAADLVSSGRERAAKFGKGLVKGLSEPINKPTLDAIKGSEAVGKVKDSIKKLDKPRQAISDVNEKIRKNILSGDAKEKYQEFARRMNEAISLGLFYELNKVKFNKKKAYIGAASKVFMKKQSLAINDPTNSKRTKPYDIAYGNLYAGAKRS